MISMDLFPRPIQHEIPAHCIRYHFCSDEIVVEHSDPYLNPEHVEDVRAFIVSSAVPVTRSETQSGTHHSKNVTRRCIAKLISDGVIEQLDSRPGKASIGRAPRLYRGKVEL